MPLALSQSGRKADVNTSSEPEGHKLWGCRWKWDGVHLGREVKELGKSTRCPRVPRTGWHPPEILETVL